MDKKNMKAFQFSQVEKLPKYIFGIVDEYKTQAKQQGKSVIDLSMGNPDMPPSEQHIELLHQAINEPVNHRYAPSIGIPELRQAICHWYQQTFDVDLDYKNEAVVTMGSKEGLAHLAIGIISAGDSVIAPDPAYPIHAYGFQIAGANVIRVPLVADETQFLQQLKHVIEQTTPKPKALVLNFPANPTTQCVSYEFLAEVVAVAKKYQVCVIHDFAYGEIYFNESRPPSILQVPGAKEIAVETYSMSKTYNMPGWRVGFVCGNAEMIGALTRIKSYTDYGMFKPLQIAAAKALLGSQAYVVETRTNYRKRRDALCDALNQTGWEVEVPEATMFVWAKIPKAYENLGSLAFVKLLIERAQVAVSPGIGFGQQGDQYVRFALIEEPEILRQAVAQIQTVFEQDQTLQGAKTVGTD